MTKYKETSDAKRGRAVQQQLRVWDILLEIRIRLQKMLVQANRLPQDKKYWSLYESSTAGDASTDIPSADTVKSSVTQVMDNMLKLKDELMEVDSETTASISETVGVEKVDDKERLLRRTQLKRTRYEIIGKNKDLSTDKVEDEDYDPEIFDDDDFYHQILRELIQRKTSNVTDPIQLSRHWLELQKLRSKTKRRVDTKASKARKIRYEVYPKLVNLMAPAEETPMTDHAIKELFGSLFG